MAARVRSVVWAQSAYAALDEVIAYIAQDSRQAAIREVFIHRYRLLYRIERDRVVVVAFLHGARDFAKWRQGQGSD